MKKTSRQRTVKLSSHRSYGRLFVRPEAKFFRRLFPYLFLVLLCLFVLPDQSRSQTSNYIRLGFRQDFNSYFYQGQISYFSPFRQKQRIIVYENYRSNLLKASSVSQKWKDDHQFRFGYRYRLNSYLQSALELKSSVFSDRQSGFFNSYDTHSLGVGLISRVKQITQIKSYLGWKFDKRYNRQNSGFYYRVESNSNPFQISEYDNRFDFEFHGNQFKGRNNQDLLFQYKIKRRFYGNTTDSLFYQFGYRKKVYYISEAGDLESRLERENNFSNLLNYEINSRLDWSILTQISNRLSSVDQIIKETATGSRERDDIGIRWESYLRWQSSKLKSHVGWIYSNKNQKFASSKTIKPSPSLGSLGIPDNRSRINSLRFFTSWRISQTDSLSSRLLISKFQYDTPDTNNFDDRDEFRTAVILSYFHRLSPSLELGVTGRANLHHVLYIFKEKSANNNWNRILQLGTSLRFRPVPSFRFYQAQEVLANYTSYDFEERQNQIRSYVYRKFTLTDSINIGHYAGIQLALFHRLEFEENGRLFWRDFSEQLIMNRRNHYLTAGVRFPLFGALILYNGIAGYIRKEWRFKQNLFGQLTKEKRGDFISFGPQLRLFLLNRANRSALISLSRFRVSTPNNQTYFINQIDLNAHWYF